MSLPDLTFPLTIDCTTEDYWIGEAGPFAFGEATTEFFCGGIQTDAQVDRVTLLEELERCLREFGGYLNAYIHPPQTTREEFEWVVNSSAAVSISYRYRIQPGTVIFLQGMTFSSLRDFLYADLCHAVLSGSGPRQCRLCGQWFFHKHGDKSIYCERIAPGETDKTCREMGARAVFEKKIQDEEPWKLYKRAYKKYYARFMKGNMSKADFKAWVEFAVKQRDGTIRLLGEMRAPEKKAALIERLKEELNRT